MNINIGLGWATLISATVLGSFVLLYNRKSSTNRLYGLSIFSVATWVLAVLMADLSKSYNTALLWTKLAIIGPAFIPSFFLYFSLNFLRKKPLRLTPFLKILLFLPSISFTVLALSRWNVKEIKIESWGTDLTPGILYVFLLSFFIIYMGSALLTLFQRMKYVSTKERLQIKYIFLGAGISTTLGLLGNLILPFLGFGRASSFGPTATLIFFGFTTYAIVKRELFGIRVVLTSLFVGLISILLLLDSLIFSANIVDKISKLFILTIFLFFGYMLIKSVLNEIRQREKMEEMAKELRRANIKLQKLDKAKSEFISIASHQLRTPLSAIKGYLSMILEGSYGKISERAKKPISNVFKASNQLNRLVNTLLNVSRIEAGKIKLDAEKTTLKEVLEPIVEEFKIPAQEKGLYITLSLPSSLPSLFLDKQKINQVIMNIIDNAIKYTKSGGIKIRAVELKRKKKMLIEIADTGLGMKKEQTTQIFKKFERGSAGEVSWVNGAGLGLFIAKKFVELHRGRIWAESKGLNKGSTFYIELPIK